MKLSEAIRLGAMIRPQARRDFFVGNGSCALGAAAEAAGLFNSEEAVACDPCDPYARMVDHFPILEKRVHSPEPRYPGYTTLANLISYLNDDYGWTRERIADFVEVVEGIEEERRQTRAEALLLLADQGRTMQPEPEHVAALAELAREDER